MSIPHNNTKGVNMIQVKWADGRSSADHLADRAGYHAGKARGTSQALATGDAMNFEADTDKTRIYSADDIADALNAAQSEAERVQLDSHAVKLVLEYLVRVFRLEVTPNDLVVRCKCGYVMRRRVDARATERWTCYTWHHRTAPKKLSYCPICGEPTSCQSTQPAGGISGSCASSPTTSALAAGTPIHVAGDRREG